MADTFERSEDLIEALRESLAVSAERALTDLGKEGGFSDSEVFKIKLPESVETFRKPLALVNKDSLLDDFEGTMNRAAEAGVAASPAIIKKVIQETTLEDLTELWQGEEDAITRFLEKRSRDELSAKMEPIIAKATDASGATSTYKRIKNSLPESTGGLFSQFQSFTGIGKGVNFDLDAYVNEKALDGLFMAMAAEEKTLRENPLARSTDLLKKLFDSTALGD
ncbi:MAG: DUF4197 domain-containing protein [Verrucomicrobiota bacterium]